MCRLRAAFTLVEILVVVVILGIATAVIVPQISSRDDLNAAAAARVVMADLMYAQNLCITQQQSYYVSFDTTAGSYSLVNAAAMTTPITHPVNQSPYTVRFGAGGNNGLTSTLLNAVNFNTAAGTGYTTIGFDELGTPMVYTGSGADQSLTSGSVTVKAGQYKLQVSVEPYTGQLSVAQVP